MSENPISAHISTRQRYVRSVDMERDMDDPAALDGYVVTPSIRDATIRILTGLSAQSCQRAFRIVGPYGTGKSAFGVFVAQLMREHGSEGPATKLLRDTIDESVTVTSWKPVIISGRRVSFTRELLNMVIRVCDETLDEVTACPRARAQALLDDNNIPDAYIVATLVSETASALRRQTGTGLLLLIDEMGRFLEHAAACIRTEDPSIFQILAERSGGSAGANLAAICFLHHRFVDYVSEQGGWIEAEWARSAERYEEIAFHGSTEQSLFMLARALEPTRCHTTSVRMRAEKLYGEATDRGLFAVSREDINEVAANLYPLHPATVATLCLATRRYGQNERSVFGFLQSLEPASFKRYIHTAQYGASNWYRVPLVFDHLSATISDNPKGIGGRRYSLAVNALANTANLPEDHRNVLKAVALIAILEPVPGLKANAGMIAWSLDIAKNKAQSILDELANLNVTYCRPHRGDYGLWSSSSVDLSRWLDEAKVQVRVPKRIEEISSLLTATRPAVAHRHYHTTGTLRTFEVALWTGDKIPERTTDGLILVAPVYPDEDAKQVIRTASEHLREDPLALICAREVTTSDLKWAHELVVWSWVRDNCEELRLDDLARAEVSERIVTAERAMMGITALLSAAISIREELWLFSGKLVSIPEGGLSALLSNICDEVFNQTPTLRSELINRVKLSTAVASARMRLLERMLNNADLRDLGLDGTPPERTIYLSLFQASGIHRMTPSGSGEFGKPGPDDPCRWGPVWNRLAERLESGEGLSFATLIEDLSVAPYGLRTAPAILLITAYVLASKDNIAILERNTFQPDLTIAHFMRLTKNPGNFVLKALREEEKQSGLLRALATGLHVTGKCQPRLKDISEKLFAWYNTLPPHTLKTKSISVTAIVVREILGKAAEPTRLFFDELPAACGAVMQTGPIDIEQFVESLNGVLLELDDVMPQLRSCAIATAVQAFGAHDLTALQSRIKDEYEPHRLMLGDYRLLVFVDRAMNSDISPEIWLDGVAGHLTGSRPDNWADETLDKFDYEIRGIAGRLTKWLALVRTRQARSADLRTIHVVDVDGREEVVVIRRNQPNPALAARLHAVRIALGNYPGAMEILGQLLVECADGQVSEKMKKEKDPV